MSFLIEYGISRRFAGLALALLAVIYLVRLTPRDVVGPVPAEPAAPALRIQDRVALISDTQYTANLVPLILHFHAVLGPGWPIVFYTSEETSARLRSGGGDGDGDGNDNGNGSGTQPSAVWQRAVAAGAIEVRLIPDEFNLTTRRGVNVFLSRPWLWAQLAPARHVLVFQTDAMLCGNAHQTVDDFLAWDFIAAPLHTREKLFNGGLSLRNRTLMMEILADPANNWEAETAAGTWTLGGEDIWFSRKMDRRGGHLPDFDTAVTFACQHDWHISKSKTPLGYHKVHKVARKQLPEIAAWCPEIALAAPGTLAQAE